MQLLQYIESIYYLFYWWDLLFFRFFYPIRRAYIWPTTFKICPVTFVLQQINTISDKITTFHWYSQPKLIFRKQLLKTFFHEFIFFIINHQFYVIVPWMQYTFFITLEEIQLITLVKWICHVWYFPLGAFMKSFKYGLILLRYSSIDSVSFLLSLIWCRIKLSL